MTFDASELNKFAAELGAAGAGIRKDVNAVVFKGATNVKSAFNESLWGSKHFKGSGGSVDFDIEITADAIEAEIGPNKSRHPGVSGPGKTRPAAPLANIAIFGGARGGGTVPDPQKHLDAEEPRIVKAMGDVIRRAIR